MQLPYILQILEEHLGTDGVAGSRVIVITDGLENEDPRVADIKPSLISAEIVVDTILLTPEATDELISLAADTGIMLCPCCHLYILSMVNSVFVSHVQSADSMHTGTQDKAWVKNL